ncbi:carboxy-terminal processing protease [Aquipluma nitroreducens]|uniref:Carboxy-terminal processing protease n=1 Tax=Aquipluma nitroreducens TaxID=2010828 RepID=A0A5K7S8Q3_9BACT|nr:S41 family peptidase [Aquipluma nitroreducens]BBE17931.1 carboxy-terminal processing protease [Aquipluma nitroreducens]
MKFSKTKKAAIVVVGIFAFAISFYGFKQDDKNFQIAKNLDIYYTLFRELNLFYVDDVDPTKLVKTSIDKMLESLDPYTNFIPEDDIEDFRFMTTGEYAGIGALISKQKGKILIAEPYEGFPAQKSGLKAGDVLLEVAGKSTEKLSTEDVSALLKGPANKAVVVKVQRYGQKKPMDVEIMREKIQIDPVPYYGMLDSETGYIRLSNFTENCTERVKMALIELKEKHGAKTLVLDLRSNPGGLLIEAVRIANLFVPKGQEIVSTRGKVKQWDKVYTATESPIDTIMPIAVLVNRGSASASEIVAGAIQDLDRGMIIGTRTFGKGLVQTTRDLSYNAKLKITTAKYYIPSGRCIQALDYTHRNEDGSVGIVPDSLISKFKTKKGRIVFDGGGVAPDLTVEDETLSNLATNLVTGSLIFDFATYYNSKTEKIASPEEFVITPEIYADFIQFVKGQDFKYESKTESELDNLLEVAKREKYYDISKDEFENLKLKLGHNLDQDLEHFKKEISELLADEIVSRYYYQKGAIKAALRDDSDVTKALDILHKPDGYAAIFDSGRIIKAN